MTGLDPLVEAYLDRGWPLLVCGWRPEAKNFKQPLLPNGVLDASRDRAVVAAWLDRWPMALIAIRTGAKPAGAGICVLDVDSGAGKRGAETMRGLGFPKPPPVPIVITPSFGRHLYFESPRDGFPNTQGAKGRGIGVDVDWRGNNGYVCAPGGVNGLYRWQRNLETCNLLPVPPELLPRDPPRAAGEPSRPEAPVQHPDAYVEAMLRRAVRDILAAGDGEQNATLNGVAFNLGRTAGRRHLAQGPLMRALIEAGCQMRAYRPHEPWVRSDVERKVQCGFRAGLAKEGK
jgi:hypothetical protein